MRSESRQRTRAKKRRLVWRQIGRPDGKRGFADWVRKLWRKSGVYIIRVPGQARIEYVGESHTGNLYETFTRHFQRWSTTKGEDHKNPYFLRRGRGVGPTWDRNAVQAAVILCKADVAVEVQDKMIRRYDPRFNWKETPESHDPLSQLWWDVPF